MILENVLTFSFFWYNFRLVICMFYRISNGSITLSGNTILEDVNFQISSNEKVGIVGRNGSGKTTLLKAITGEIPFEDGYDLLKIEKIGNYKIGYIKQEVNRDLNITLLDYILESFEDIINIGLELSKLEEEMSNNYSDSILIRYNELMDKFNLMGGYSYKKEYEIALKKFGFTEEDKLKKISEFSGGELTKLSLVRLLLSKPDLLILDEPTNHLDINAISWLENYLKNYSKSLIVVSHDRMFLDNVCNVIYEIEYGSLKRYNGNYSYFVKQKELNYQKQLKDYEEQQREIKRLQSIADRFRYKPTKASMAMSKLKQIERMVKIDKPVSENKKTFKRSVEFDKNSYHDVLKVKNLSIGYNNVLNTMSFSVYRSDKLGIIGDNGIGKSTLLKTLMGYIPPISGKYVFGPNVNIGYFSQNLDNLDNNNSIYDEIDHAFPKMNSNEIRTLLGSFEFSGDDVFKKIGSLSGGEKVRVSLCKILNSNPNVLILDEPTNHLDIISKNTIEGMLKEYNGSIIMVSHDRYLIKNVCNKLLEFTKEGVNYYNFGYTEYMRKIENPVRENLINSIKKVNIKEVNKNYRDNNINKKIKIIEKEIDNLSIELDKLNKKMLQEDVYMDYNKAMSIQEKIDSINTLIDEKTDEWDNLVNNLNM